MKRPLLTKTHEYKRLAWPKKYLKLSFRNVLFTNEPRISLDGSDGWARGWVGEGGQGKTFIKRQQEGGGIMIWAGIIGNRVIRPFKVDEGVEINS